MKPTRIVVIEDDTDLRQALCTMLRYDGHEVSGFADARDAIRELEGGLPADIILLDLMMPFMSGWDFCDYRAGSPALARIPVILVTARQAVAPPVGVAGVLLKPFGVDELEEAMAKVLG